MGMTYDELSVFGRMRKNLLCGPYSMFCKLAERWSNHLSPVEVSSTRTICLPIELMMADGAIRCSV